MPDVTKLKTKISLRYPDEANGERTKSFTFSNLALNAAGGKLLDLSDAFVSLMYNPAMAAAIVKRESFDLADD